MKSIGAVKHQLQQVIFRYVKKQLRENFRRAPETCKYNGVITAKDNNSVRLCFYEDPATGAPRRTLCDSNYLDQARDCPLWEPCRTKESIKREFRKLILQGDRGQIAARFPDIAALLWVLDTDEDRKDLEDMIREAPEEDPIEQPTSNHPPEVSGDGGQSEVSPAGTSRDGTEGPRTLPGNQVERGSNVGR